MDNLDPEKIAEQFQVDLNKVKDQIMWDFDVNNEFKNRKKGFAFVIDVLDGSARLSIYKASAFVSQTTEIAKQPPREMLQKAVEEQGGSLNDDNLYNINGEVKNWIMENLM